jgi:hypothetical protein
VKKKNKDEISVRVPESEARSAIPIDEFHGMGGSYILDPVAGKRTRAAGPSEQAAIEQSATEQPEVEALTHEGE